MKGMEKKPRQDFRHLLLRKEVKKEKVKGASPMLSMGASRKLINLIPKQTGINFQRGKIGRARLARQFPHQDFSLSVL